MVRTKAVAVLLGPSGIGLVSMDVSITDLVSNIAQLGRDQSGVVATPIPPQHFSVIDPAWKHGSFLL
jgi:hypothetical protein